MKALKITLAGREQYLAFTVEAMFQIQDEFGGTSELVNIMQGGGRDSCSAACRAAAILSEQGELARRALGYDHAPMVDAADISATLSPKEAADLKLAVSAAISLGFGRELTDEDDEVDLGLAELNEQEKTP